MMEKYINSLIQLSHSIGKHISYAQGGGGNTSIKIDKKNMLIKSSGYKLRDMSSKQGYCTVNYMDIINIIKTKSCEDIGESELYDAIKKSSLDDKTPSIETGFHSLLPYKCIAHSHSVYTNVLTCSKEGYEISKKIFKDHKVLWIGYKNPGKYLTYEISKQHTNEKVIFLENHGLIVCEDNINSLINLHESINYKIKEYFPIKDFNNISDKHISANKNKILFPDQVIFMTDPKLKSSDSFKENSSAYSYILETIIKLNLTPIFIKDKDINYIKEMESEKFRKKISN